MAASTPPARWKTSTTSARFTSREATEIVLSAGLAGRALAVPALEGLSQAVPHVLAEAELRRELFGGRPMVVEDAVDVAPAVADERDADPRAVQERTSRAEVLQHEARPGMVDEREVGLERQIVTEPLRLLVRVDVAAHPREERGVVDVTRSVSFRPMRSASRIAIRHSRRTCSIG